jgi:ankyrin repeat protein
MTHLTAAQRAAVGVLACIGSIAAQSPADPWYQAIRNDDLAAARAMIKGGSINIKERRGNTPLMYASAFGTPEMVKLLVEAGAGVNAQNEFGATALLWAASDLSKVRLLLAHGADVNTRTNAGRTPLMAAAYADGSIGAVKLLVSRGARIDVKDGNGTAFLNIAAQSDNAAVVRFLVSRGAAVDSSDAVGQTPLFWAATNADAELTDVLLKRGADPRHVTAEIMMRVKNGPLEDGRIGVLNLAAAYGGARTIGLLISAGADVNAVETGHGFTPLTRAITTDRPDLETVRLLIAHGAKPHLKAGSGESAAEWAARYRNPDVLAAMGLPLPAADPEISASPGRKRAEIRESAERSLKLLQQTSAGFMQRGGCISCHAQNMTGIAVGIARGQHLAIDERLAAASAKETSAMLAGPEQLYLQLLDPLAGQDGAMYSLLQLSAQGFEPGWATDAAAFYLTAAQHPDGSWRSIGMARPPIEDASILNTAMGLRCLQLYMIPARRREFEERIRRAARWLETSAPRSTNELAWQLLGLRWASDPAARTALKELLAIQRRLDGGWAQTPWWHSDAYGTGLALYALHQAGVPSEDSAYQRGVHYLLDTQEPDGSWHVASRSPEFQPYFQSGFPHGHDQWISQAGTAWAAIGLAYAVNDSHAVSSAERQ